MKDFTYPDNWEFSKASASEWGREHLHKCAVRPLRISTPEFGEGDEFGKSSSAELEQCVELLKLLGLFADRQDLFIDGDMILRLGCAFVAFYFGLRELFLFSSVAGRKKRLTLAASTQTPTVHPLILSGKRTRTPAAVHEGIVSGELLERMHLIDEHPSKDVSTPTHKRNASDGSFQADVNEEEDIDLMAERVADEGIASSVFNTFCTISQAYLESYTPPTNGFVVRYTIHPVSYYTKTAFGAFRARSDGAACLHPSSQSAGFSATRHPEFEELFLIEAKAFEGAVAEPQQFAQCLSFISKRVQKLFTRGYTFETMKTLPEWYSEVYILCINQLKYQLKRVRFSPEYLALVLGEKTIDGGRELQKFNTQLECFDTKQTYIASNRKAVVHELHALCMLRIPQVLELHNLPKVSAP